MKTDMKKIPYWALLAAAVLPLSCFSQNFESEGLYYDVIGDGEVEVAKMPDNTHVLYSGSIQIPETVNYEGVEYKVTRIADLAFSNSAVTDVQIPNSVEELGDSVFYFAQDLENVTLPVHMTEIPAGTFAGTSIKAVAIPEGVKTIGEGAFQTCVWLETVFLPSTLQKIEAYGFNNCHMLHEIYCMAAVPPVATGWAIFLDLTNIDLLVPEESAESYAQVLPWNDPATFSIWPPETFEISLPSYKVNGEWIEFPLGSNVAYKIYEGDNLIALTAADFYRVPRKDVTTAYTIVPTNYFSDANPIVYVIDSASVGELVADDEVLIGVSDGDIVLSGNYGKEEVSIYDASGKLICRRFAADGVISGLQSGNVYIVKCGSVVRKLAL